MLALLIVLAQTAAAQPTPAPAERATPAPTRTPAPTPRPAVAPTAIPRGDGTNTGLAGAASRVKLNRRVSFDDIAAKAPSAQPTKDPAAGTAEAEKPCETVAFKGQIDGVVGRFQGESRTASLTPRSALAAPEADQRSTNAVTASRVMSESLPGSMSPRPAPVP
jgi:hypothetical protein